MSNDLDLDALAAELSDFAVPDKAAGRTPREERIIAGFEDIQRFFDQHGHAPRHGEHRDIFERLYAVRLNRLCESDEYRALLLPLDQQGLLSHAAQHEPQVAYALSDDELLAELSEGAAADIQTLRHVRSSAEKRESEDVAQREPCQDFDRYSDLFDRVRQDLKSGLRQTQPFGNDAGIDQGQFFILGGQTAYVADKGATFFTPQGHPDARLRVIYSNGTESNLLLRSLQRALYKDAAGRRIVQPDGMPLFDVPAASQGGTMPGAPVQFGESLEPGDIASGTIYVLRSLSSHPFIAAHRELIHKIGVTGGKVQTRIAHAAHDATYLLADVQVVAEYRLANIDAMKLEQLLHRLFASARIDQTIADRFGNPVNPQEWFLVPLHVIDEAVTRIRDGSITDYQYDAGAAELKRR